MLTDEPYGPYRLWIRRFSYGWKIGTPAGDVMKGTYKTKQAAEAAAKRRWPLAEITR
jgi:hypothetical protein